MDELQFRMATLQDLPAIASILNQAILQGGQTAYTAPVDVADRELWLAKHSADQWPAFVVEKAGHIVGWCCFSPHRAGRSSLASLAEVTYYLDANWQGQGIGTATLEFLITEGAKRKFRNLFAILMDTNAASIHLLKKKGFQQWGHLPEVAEVDGRICGQVIYGRKV